MLDQLQSETSLTAPFEEFSLKPMPLSHRQEIIEKPARIAGLKVEERLVTQAMQDSSTEDALPLLAFALRALYERFGHDGDLTYAQYVSLGDAEYQASGDGKSGLNPVENAIRRRADEVIADIGASQKDLDALRDAFSPALVHIDDKGEYARQTAPLSKLPSAALPLIEKLINARLLVEHAEGGERMIEVTHESLLRKWPLLRGWLDEERDFLAGIQRLEQDLRDWEAAPADQKSAALLTGLEARACQDLDCGTAAQARCAAKGIHRCQHRARRPGADCRGRAHRAREEIDQAHALAATCGLSLTRRHHGGGRLAQLYGGQARVPAVRVESK